MTKEKLEQYREELKKRIETTIILSVARNGNLDLSGALDWSVSQIEEAEKEAREHERGEFKETLQIIERNVIKLEGLFKSLTTK